MVVWDICRLCLQTKDALQEQNINCKMNKLSNVMMIQDTQITKAYAYCTGLLLHENDQNLPNEICDICKKKLIISYSFKKQCVESNEIMKAHLATVFYKPSVAEYKIFKNYTFDKRESTINNNCKEIPAENRATNTTNISNDDRKAENEDIPDVINADSNDCIYEVVEIPESSNDGYDEVQQINDQNNSQKETVEKNLSDFSELSSEESMQSWVFQDEEELPKTGQQTCESQKVMCQICGVFFGKYSLKHHLEIKHTAGPKKPTDKRKYKKLCTLCGKLVYDLKVHIFSHKQIPYDERPFACEICDMRFKCKTILRGHMHTHSDAKRYPCPHCDEMFRGYHTRVQHITQYHTGEYRFECNLCDAKFWLMARFKEHRKRVHGVQPENPPKKMDARANPQLLECKQCGKKFKKIRFLREHMTSHSGEGDDNHYECPVCQEVCSQNGELRIHIINSHPEFNLPPHNVSLKKKSLSNYIKKKFHR